MTSDDNQTSQITEAKTLMRELLPHLRNLSSIWGTGFRHGELNSQVTTSLSSSDSDIDECMGALRALYEGIDACLIQLDKKKQDPLGQATRNSLEESMDKAKKVLSDTGFKARGKRKKWSYAVGL